MASANGGLISAPTVLSGGAVAVGPALGATLVGRTTVNAPETTIVKQQVIVDQPEIRYRAVPVQTVVQTVAAPQLVAAPQVAVARSVVSPQLISAPQVAIARSVVSPQLISANQIALAAPQLRSVVAPQISTLALQGNTVQTIASPLALQSQLIAGVGSQTLLASPTSTLVGSPTVLALKK